MQAPLQNETRAIQSRFTVGRRELTYHLEIAQQPERARACGSGPRSSADRRPVDPPPVVKLTIMHGNVDITNIYDGRWVMYAALEHARPIAKGTIYATNHCPVLCGTTCASAAMLTKPANAAYFIFPDMSIRHEGYYRFKFHLMEHTKRREDYDVNLKLDEYYQGTVDAPPPNPEENLVNLMYVYSKPFQVFSAKKFPGLKQSTELSKIIADQGCRVRIRRDIRQRKKETGKGSGKDDDQRSIRAASHDRIGSLDGQEPYNQTGPNTRQPSVDSQFSQSYVPSRQPSYAQPTMSSPIVASPSSFAYTGGYDGTSAASPHIAKSTDMYLNRRASSTSYMPPISSTPQSYQQPMGPPTHRPSYTPIAPSPSTLPSISAMMNPCPSTTPAQPPRPAGGLYALPSPSAQKRSRYSPSRETPALKDRARPSLIPKSLASPYGYTSRSSMPYGGQGQVVGPDDTIEPDTNDGEDDGDSDDDDGYGGLLAANDSDSGPDDVLEVKTSYRRANGKMQHVPFAGSSYRY